MNIELLAINIGESANRVRKFTQSFNLSFPVLLDQSSFVSDRYDILGVPTYVIINKAGKIVFIGNRFAKEKLKELKAE